jgi:hypothetical protein
MTSSPQRNYPEWKKTVPVRIDLATKRVAESQIKSCETCTPDQAEVPFDYVLDSITGYDPETIDYLLPEPAHCPRCGGEVRVGFWRWSISEDGNRSLFILPGTLVVLKAT